ncbi:response regulator [Alkalihalobacillus oceani]|uniref:Response regulator n=1 Tax=Halalkalibacter oceani TaxID=1653776 RepID=A0A9X2DP99_9BACI|nr:response regulator [Halalkalibacter oceani]MCM3714596.1 response regulator [Halalkalibacter oceani]
MIKIVAVEDDPLVAKFHRKYVEKVEGFSWLGSASTIEEGEQLVKKPEVDLVLLDIYIHDQNGLDLLKKIRAQNVNVDVILITSANDQQSVQTGYRYGVVDYLIKPFTFERFQEALLHYKDEMAVSSAHFRQEEVDRFFYPRQPGQPKSSYVLPKGITKETCIRILQAMAAQEGWKSATELSDMIGVSHVSLRKYLRYFEQQNWIQKDVVYHSFGRPLQQYRLAESGKKVLEQSDFI